MKNMTTVQDIEDYICAIVVTFNPKVSSLVKTLQELSRQVDKVIIVDNNSNSDLLGKIEEFCAGEKDSYDVISLSKNSGIAEAQNIGISKAYTYPCNHIIFMDHDSIPEVNMVKNLISVETKILEQGLKVGAVGPTLIDRRTKSKSGFVKKNGIFISRKYPQNENVEFVETDFIISSGTLVRTSVLKDVGGMNSGYFIDHVDTEWCFRVTDAGYKIFGARNAFLNHHLGEKVVKIWFGRWREVPRHNDFRYYYIFRNTIVMIKNVPMATSWKIAHLYRLSIFLFFFGLLCNASKKRWKFMFQGISDGMKTRMGQYNRHE